MLHAQTIRDAQKVLNGRHGRAYERVFAGAVLAGSAAGLLTIAAVLVNRIQLHDQRGA